MKFDWFFCRFVISNRVFWVLITCKHRSKLLLQVEFLCLSPMRMSRCLKREKFSRCSVSHGENMKSLISLISQPFICRKLIGTKYLCFLSPTGILTRIWSIPWNTLKSTGPYKHGVSLHKQFFPRICLESCYLAPFTTLIKNKGGERSRTWNRKEKKVTVNIVFSHCVGRSWSRT